LKNIYITPALQYRYKKSLVFYLEHNWYKYSNKIKFNLIPIINVVDLKKKIVKIKPHGLIISGGGDISKIKKNLINQYRDKNEIELYHYFNKLNLPILAVCRGFQLLYTLHKNNLGIAKNHINKTHRVEITNKDELFNFKQIITNSYHKYCAETSKGLEIIGKHDDGTIEISKIKKKVLMFMFHPERKNLDQKKIDRVFKKFFNI
jgi:gamma-glutamyl-gamma-aminobutyrate hydrolase PuuD